MADLTDPKEDYSSHLRQQHAENVSEYFEHLVDLSQVDIAQNAATVAAYKRFNDEIQTIGKTRSRWFALRIVIWILCALTIFASPLVAISLGNQLLGMIGIAVAIFVMTIGVAVAAYFALRPKILNLKTQIADLEALRDEEERKAWAQMEPLNRLHSWDAARFLFNKTLPEVELDSFFTAEKLEDLWSNFDLPTSVNDGRSVLTTQSGSFKGNPFAVTKFLSHWMGTKTYYGSRVINWTEQSRDSDGNLMNVQRSQTLTASVTKPYPEYNEQVAIFFGHEAAPNLNFTRQQSRIAQRDGASLDRGVNRALKKIERRARKHLREGTGDLTVMSNREFEALFNATDRDDEIEFRLLFTPLAQEKMVELLTDQEVAYGDDFSFSKYGKINILGPGHLAAFSFDAEPRRFMSFDFEEAKRFFHSYHNEYFKTIFFGIAPALTIPSYRESRSTNAGADSTSPIYLSFWEYEAMANYLGQPNFAHPSSVTQNILRAEADQVDDNLSTATIGAFGYSAHNCLDYISVRGGDGNVHQVPVNSVDYIPVENFTNVLVCNLEGLVDQEVDQDVRQEEAVALWEEFLSQQGVEIDNYVTWRGFAITLLPVPQ